MHFSSHLQTVNELLIDLVERNKVVLKKDKSIVFREAEVEAWNIILMELKQLDDSLTIDQIKKRFVL